MENLTQLDWSERVNNDKEAVIIDVRTTSELAAGVIRNAIHLDIMETQSFTDQVKDWDKEKNYFLYCQAGGRSGSACQLMDSLGFKNTYNLQGGMMSWIGETVSYDK